MSDETELVQQGAVLGYTYGTVVRALEKMAKAFRIGFERGRTGTVTPEQSYQLREARRVAAHQRRIDQERAKGRRFVDGLLADLRREVIR